VPKRAALTPAAIELLAVTDAREIRARLVRLGLEQTGADRCTLTSIDRGVFRVEDSHDVDGRPEFIGREYPLSYLEGQPLVREAVTTGRCVTGGSLAEAHEVAPELSGALQEVRRTAIVPLKLGVDVGAFFVLSRRHDRPFAVADLERLREIGGMAVLALRNSRLLEGVTAPQRRGLDALTLISEHVASSEGVPSFFGRMSTMVAGLAGAMRVAYWMVEGDDLVAQREMYGFDPGDTGWMRRPLRALLDAGLSGVLYGGEALHIERSHDRAATATIPIAPPGVDDLLAVPWRTSEGPLGLLAAYDSVAGFAEQDEWIMRLSARASALVWQSNLARQRASELQSAELERLRHHASRMAAVERQKVDFLKLASHELRGPITVIRGYISMLSEGAMGPLDPGVLTAVERMESQVVQMKDLVDQMLSAARLEDTQVPVRLSNTRIDQVIRDVVATFSELQGQRERIVIDGLPPTQTLADRRHVETIITNLVSNAIKYSPDGGDVLITLRESQDHVEVEVRDEGIGIDPAAAAMLFQPFSRLEEAETLSIGGVGLGLFLSRELARVQGGDITMRSEPGHGSVFTLRLPSRAVRIAS